jgi:3',5'-nucleoside bisphosphate phosphatase
MPSGGSQARVDLHLHSVHSDGTHTVADLVAMAVAAGLSAISLTDHDTVAGLPGIREAARGTGLEIVNGVELSSSAGASDLHVLGYFFDPENADLLQGLAWFRNGRRERLAKMVSRLNELGVEVSEAEVARYATSDAPGRPHVAQALLDLGFVDTFDDAFRRYLAHYAPAYVPKPRFAPKEAVGLIRRAGGAPVLAHPGTLGRDELIPELVEAGLLGIEAWHPKHSSSQVTAYRRLAREHGLVATGGSDYHGEPVGVSTVGFPEVPAGVLAELRARL